MKLLRDEAPCQIDHFYVGFLKLLGGYFIHLAAHHFFSLLVFILGNCGKLLRRKVKINKLVETCLPTGNTSIVVKSVSTETTENGFSFWLCQELAV